MPRHRIASVEHRTDSGPACIDCLSGGPRPWPTCLLCERCYADLIAGLRRRYEAALRLCPIGDGPRDPMTEVAA